MSERAWSEDRATMFLVSAVMVVAGACGGRTLSGGGETGSGESGSLKGSAPEELLACDGPNAPTGPIELVGGQMQPKSFVRVGERIYWADAWDQWADEPPSTTLYRAEAVADGPWIPVALEQPGVNQIVDPDEEWPLELVSATPSTAMTCTRGYGVLSCTHDGATDLDLVFEATSQATSATKRKPVKIIMPPTTQPGSTNPTRSPS